MIAAISKFFGLHKLAILTILGLSLTVGALSLYIYIGNVKDDRDRYKRERNTAQAALETANATVKLCNDQQKTNAEVSRGYQKKITAIASSRDDLFIRLRECSATVCVTEGYATGGPDDGPTGNRISGAVGVTAGTIINEAASCDENTERLIGLQEWVRRQFTQ